MLHCMLPLMRSHKLHAIVKLCSAVRRMHQIDYCSVGLKWSDYCILFTAFGKQFVSSVLHICLILHGFLLCSPTRSVLSEFLPWLSLDHRRNFTLNSSGDQWRRQGLVSGGHDDRGTEGTSIDAPKAPSGVGYGKGCPIPTLLGGLAERRELPCRFQGGAPAAIAFSARFRPQNTSGNNEKLQIPL